MPAGTDSPPSNVVDPPPTPVLKLDGGLVATNDVTTIALAIRSLLSQELPSGVAWDKIWVVVSGSSDGSADVARDLAVKDRRIRLVLEPVRRGTARALGKILERSEAPLLVLLNADARAEPGALLHLLAVTGPLPGPFGVMARPTVPPLPPGLFSDSLQLLWYLHHRLHEMSLGGGDGNHLSDELLLLSRSAPTDLPGQVINDGAYLGARLRLHAGKLHYASQARVLIQVPASWGDLLSQRTRIRRGHTQIRDLTGQRPTTLPGYFLAHPREVLRWLKEAPSEVSRPRRALLFLGALESVAWLRARWGWGDPGQDPAIWPRLRTLSGPRVIRLPEPVEGSRGDLQPPGSDQRAERALFSSLGAQVVIPPKPHEVKVSAQRQEH